MSPRRSGAAAAWLRRRWTEHGEVVLRAAIGLMTVAALAWLSYEFWRLVWGEAPIWPGSPEGAVDVKLIHHTLHAWFASESVFGAVYPPATWAMLWPLLGWLDVGPGRWLWALATVAALGALIAIMVRESGARSRTERAFVALLPCSIYATGAATGNGQLIVLLLPRCWRRCSCSRGRASGARSSPRPRCSSRRWSSPRCRRRSSGWRSSCLAFRGPFRS